MRSRFLRTWPSLFLLGLASCSGPDAPDVAICRDLIHRLCVEPRCAVVNTTLAVDSTCEDELLVRTGCADDAFTFEGTGLTRARFLDCRTPLLRTSSSAEVRPACEDIDESFAACEDDLVPFLRPGAQP